MIPKNEPYFMSNEDWYKYDEKSGRYVLTNKATDKAKESYKEFYSLLDKRFESTL